MLDHVGRVESAAEADFEDAGVRRRAREGEQGDRGRDLEEARFDSGTRVEHLGQKFRQRLIVDQAARDPDPLIEADEVRAGEGVYRTAARFERRAEKSDGRALSVRSGDMEDWREPVLWSAKALEHGGDAIEAEPVARR